MIEWGRFLWWLQLDHAGHQSLINSPSTENKDEDEQDFYASWWFMV